MKIILSNNQDLLPEIMQKLYDNIIIYFTNRNYFYEVFSNADKTEVEFRINLHTEMKGKKENKIQSSAMSHISENFHEFETFTELIKIIFTAIKKLEETKLIESNKRMYERFYA